jgi:hypothetical protein
MVTMSYAQIQSLILSAAEAMSGGHRAAQVGPALGSKEQEEAEKVERAAWVKANPSKYVPYVSREPFGTGAGMLLVISPRGYVVGIHRYTHPIGYDVTIPKGREPGPLGRLFPSESNHHRDGSLTMTTKHMIYHQYYLRDNHFLLRRPLIVANVMTPEEIAEWQKVNPDFLKPEQFTAVGSVEESDAA